MYLPTRTSLTPSNPSCLRPLCTTRPWGSLTTGFRVTAMATSKITPFDLTGRPELAVRIAAVSYQATLQRWHDFYAIPGQGAASLVGLLFVGLSLHIRMVLSRVDVRALAR